MDSHKMTQEMHLRHWSALLREQKSSGQSVKSWCEEQGINRQRYFYWQRKIREAACALVQREVTRNSAPEGWSLCTPAISPEKPKASHLTVLAEQVYIETDGMRILAGREYPVENLARLLRALAVSC